MRRALVPWVLAGCVGAAFAQVDSAASAGAPALAGFWRGEARLPGGVVETFLEIALGPDGPWAALTIPGRQAFGAPLDTFRARGRAVEIDAPAFGGRYRGTLAADDATIRGAWESPGASVPLDFSKVASIPGATGEPPRPYPYREEQVSYVNEAAGIRFRGTLTIPNGPGPHPAAMTITGAGCQDRDESLGPAGALPLIRPFRLIADKLTRQGVAVLRVDDRGHPGTGGNVLDATSEDVAGDVLAGVAFLSKRPDIDASRIGLIGHSEGGMVAMIAASKRPETAFVVSMAGPAEDCRKIAWGVFSMLVRPDDLSEPVKTVTKLLMRQALKLLQSDAPETEVKRRLGILIPKQFLPLVTCRWTRFIATYDPRPAIEKVRCPIFGLFAEVDGLVLPEVNAAALRTATERGGNQDVTIVTYPGLSHIFVNAVTPGAEARAGPLAFSPRVVEDIGRWVVSKTARSPASRPSR